MPCKHDTAEEQKKGGSLLVLEDGGALLGKGGHALLLILVGKGKVEEALLVVEALLERQLERCYFIIIFLKKTVLFLFCLHLLTASLAIWMTGCE